MPGCLHPKLLSICNQCYAPSGFDASTIGWATGDPGDPCGTEVDSALVGRVGNAIVVAYRGTLAPGGSNPRAIIDDWVNNVQTEMVPRAGLGNVHRGFWESHHALWGAVKERIAERLNPAPPRAIIVTGHSKGGAVAFLGAAAIREVSEWKNIPIHVVTFAGPRAGGSAFADTYKSLNIPTLRYENRADLVPYVPLAGATQPFVWSLLKALGAKYPVTGFVGVGDALVDGPGAFQVSLDWATIGWRLARSRFSKEGTLRLVDAIPLVDAHRIDQPGCVYSTMVREQERRCAQQRHAECLAALG